MVMKLEREKRLQRIKEWADMLLPPHLPLDFHPNDHNMEKESPREVIEWLVAELEEAWSTMDSLYEDLARENT